MQIMIENWLQGHGEVREQARTLLLSLMDEGIPEVRADLIELAETADYAKYRAEAMVLFGSSGDPAFAVAVEGALRNDPSPAVRAYAAAACISYPQLAGVLLWAQTMDSAKRVRKVAGEMYRALDEMGVIEDGS